MYKYLNSLGINSVEQCRDFDEQIFRELKKQQIFNHINSQMKKNNCLYIKLSKDIKMMMYGKRSL